MTERGWSRWSRVDSRLCSREYLGSVGTEGIGETRVLVRRREKDVVKVGTVLCVAQHLSFYVCSVSRRSHQTVYKSL